MKASVVLEAEGKQLLDNWHDFTQSCCQASRWIICAVKRVARSLMNSQNFQKLRVQIKS